MKAIFSLLLSVVLLLALVSCGGDSVKTDIPENTGSAGEITTDVVTEAEPVEAVPEVFYTGIYYQTPSSGTARVHVHKTDGTTDDLGERGVYGYPDFTDDGKYVAYRQTKRNDAGDYTERLFVMTPGGKTYELAENASSFVLDDDGEYIVARCKDGLYYTNDLTAPAEKIVDGLFTSVIVSTSKSKIACVDKDNTLHFVDIAAKTDTVVADGVEHVMKRVCDNAVYYATDSGLYVYANGTSTFVSDWWLSTDFGQIFATGTERERSYHYLTVGGTLFDIPSEARISSLTHISSNEKYLVSGSGDTVLRYEITDTGLISKTEFQGDDLTLYMVNDDGVIFACASGSQSFGVYENAEYKKLSDGILLARKMGYSPCVHLVDDGVYFSYEDTLYKYTIGGTIETVAENIYSFAANGEWCCYTANYDQSKEYGDMYEAGRTDMVDDFVKYIYG